MNNASPLTRPAPICADVLRISARDAARMLAVSERTLWSTRPRAASLMPVRIGARCLYSPDVLREWIASQTTSALTE